MLQLSKNQLEKGQQVSIDIENLIVEKDEFDKKLALEYVVQKAKLQHGDILTLQKISGGVVEALDPNGNTLNFFWSWFKLVTKLEGENLGVNNTEYVIMKSGKRYKPKKFADMGKIKASLLCAMDFHYLYEELSRKNSDNCPEACNTSAPYYMGGEVLTRDEFKELEIYEWKNKKIGDKIDFSPVDFYDEQMFLVTISAKYGSAARELFKKMTKEHKFMFIFMHEDYSQQYPQYEDLKESEIIKGIMKRLKIAGTVKASKYGKTAIALQTATEMATIINELPENSRYLLVDVKGNQLLQQEKWFVLASSREERMAEIFLN